MYSDWRLKFSNTPLKLTACYKTQVEVCSVSLVKTSNGEGMKISGKWAMVSTAVPDQQYISPYSLLFSLSLSLVNYLWGWYHLEWDEYGNMIF